jgi:hypothetical protein
MDVFGNDNLKGEVIYMKIMYDLIHEYFLLYARITA